MKAPLPRIRILVATNPKRHGCQAWHRFNLYKNGQTVDDFYAAGGRADDLRNDIGKKFIDLTTLAQMNGSAPKANSNREAAVNRIRALLAKTTANGCTEEEAFAAAAKAGELMDKYGIESTETEIRAEKCVTGIHGGHRQKAHESKWVASAIAEYCSCRVWHVRGTGHISFFGLPQDAEVATYLMQVVEGAMDRSLKAFKATPDYPTWEEPRKVRTTFMQAMAIRINSRLREMHKARHTETMTNATGTSLVLVKNAVVAEQFAALGMTLTKGRYSTSNGSTSAAAAAAGRAAGDRVHLGGGITGDTSSKRIG
jgi:hypothetical protein